MPVATSKPAHNPQGRLLTLSALVCIALKRKQGVPIALLVNSHIPQAGNIVKMQAVIMAAMM